MLKKLIKALIVFLALGAGAGVLGGAQQQEPFSLPSVIFNQLHMGAQTVESSGSISWDRRHTVSSWVTVRETGRLAAPNDGATTGVGPLTARSLNRHTPFNENELRANVETISAQ